MNTIVGMIIVLGMAVLSLFKGSEFITSILVVPEISTMLGAEKLSALIACGTLIITIFGIGLTCTTISRISLKGKNLWNKKTLPVSVKKKKKKKKKKK